MKGFKEIIFIDSKEEKVEKITNLFLEVPKMTIYRFKEGKEKILKPNDSQIKELNIPFKDIYIDTSIGKTHLIKTGNFNKEALLVFHGGNSTTAYNLLNIDYLLNDFHVFTFNTMGIPRKSAEVSLSPNNYDYRKWACEVISKLGYESII